MYNPYTGAAGVFLRKNGKFTSIIKSRQTKDKLSNDLNKTQLTNNGCKHYTENSSMNTLLLLLKKLYTLTLT